MATARRMPTNVDVLDELTENINQNGNTTEIGGNAEIDGDLQVNGNLQVNQPVTVNVNDSLTEGYHVERTTTSYDYDTVYASSKIIINQKNKNGTIKSTREFSFPPKGGTIVAGLYRHTVLASAIDAGNSSYFQFVVISSNNTQINSLTTLKTILGNNFEYPVSGRYSGNDTAFVKMTETTVYDSEDSGFDLTEYDFQDYVTAV